jgi:hypothetical protein
MKKTIFTILISFGLALPAAIASADPIADGYFRDLERASSPSSAPVRAEREISYIDFFESDPVKASYYRDIYRINPQANVEAMEARADTYHWIAQ